MKIHEYQAKELLAKYGVPVSAGEVAFNPAEVKRIARGLSPEKKLVLKAQVHAGGRGKAGGIKIVNNPSEAEKTAESMFGMKLVTPQTGAEGKTVRRLLVTEAEEIEKEYYAGIVLDRSKNQLVYMVSKEGGVDIEKVAAEAPEKIVKEYIDRSSGVLPYQARSLAFALGLENGLFKQGVQFFLALYGAFAGEDCSLAEINPLIVTKDGSLVALDVKVNLDDNALFRHPELAQLRDYDEEDPLEVEASKHHLNYIKLNGTVGCMVNGAGLAMATMDIIKLAGAEPANFLDVGGGASAETVENGFRIILADKNVKAILINIFGGIVRCDRVAKGVVEASKKIGVKLPIVVRLAGTNAEEAALLLEESGMDFFVAHDLKEAAQNVVRAIG
ncbi:succinate--CoA ligase subunit beta [candidate division KSB1 bacterium RBG_16_48_16]|nr:MAG: succinate--CoA ligase subunit beta [candidate division KSB1 bacterium RBG_16_48_16]